MLIERIVFTIVALYLLIFNAFRLIKRVDKVHIFILILQGIGLILELIEIIGIINYNIIIKLVLYLISIVIPILVIFVERKGRNASEIVYIAMAKFYKIIGNSKKSKEIWLMIADKFSESYIAHRTLAQIYEKEGGMRKAIDEYVKTLDLNKKDYDSYYRISFLLNELGKKEDAATMLNNLIAKKPDYIDASMLLRRYLGISRNV